MFFLVIILLAISLCLNIWIYRNHVSRNKAIKYTEQKLQSIIDHNTDEKLLLFTDDKQIKAQLIQINRLLEHNQMTVANYNQVEQSIKKMLSNISHDLKTPLTVVLGYVEMILHDEGVNDEKWKTMLQIVNLKTVEALDLIQRFFELVRLESGDKKLEMLRIEIGEVCRSVILDYYEVLTHKEFEVSIEIPEEPIFVWGNEVAIKRILHNLISNAIQYAASGRMIGVRIRTNDDHAYVDITDKGKGISELHKNHVFERLYTMEDSRNKLYQGSGLGLTITKRLVEQMGGNIFLDSTPFEKTTFTVELKRISY